MLGLCVPAAREGMLVDLGLDLLGGVCDKDGTGGIAGTHLAALSLHRSSGTHHHHTMRLASTLYGQRAKSTLQDLIVHY